MHPLCVPYGRIFHDTMKISHAATKIQYSQANKLINLKKKHQMQTPACKNKDE